MPNGFVQGKGAETASSSSDTANLTSAATVGNLLVCGVYAFGETTGSISVQALVGGTPTSDTWTKVLSSWQADSGGSDWLNLFVCVPTTAGITAVKASGPSGTGFWGAAAGEFSGLGMPTINVAGGSAANGTGTTYTGPAFTPSAGDLVLAFHGNEDSSITITAGTGWSLASASGIGDNNCGLIYILSGTATSTTGKWAFNRAMNTSAGSVYVSLTPGSAGPTDPFPAGYGHPYKAMGNYLSRL